ncbi:WbqC family protein [Caenimonas soli]|uniref:WbqC family protein n=1 Tax=Caenimonas soli TaxID=2735555 RepID=UPI0015527968|nr:WbqC family protein [Caenimonas soli]NPC55771.1 WbqC family protein [Caenimonas soli]
MKSVAVLQSNYIPWKGYFDLIASVDEFILFDDMQYTRRDWRNRNQIKTPQGLHWLTVPVKVKGKYHQSIRETEIDGTEWAPQHWKALCQNYRRAKRFDEVAAWLEPIFLAEPPAHLSTLNRTLIEAVCRFLGIKTLITNSWDYELEEGKTERLAGLCAQAGGARYVSGPSAKDYIDENVFTERGLDLAWFEYGGYPPYPQLWGEFVHNVSILDLLFNCGSEAPRYMKHVTA